MNWQVGVAASLRICTLDGLGSNVSRIIGYLECEFPQTLHENDRTTTALGHNRLLLNNYRFPIHQSFYCRHYRVRMLDRLLVQITTKTRMAL
jgi:hypothetical protein